MKNTGSAVAKAMPEASPESANITEGGANPLRRMIAGGTEALIAVLRSVSLANKRKLETGAFAFPLPFEFCVTFEKMGHLLAEETEYIRFLYAGILNCTV